MVDKNAQALGRKAAGKPKNFSAAERKRRAARLAAARAKRWLSKSNAEHEPRAVASRAPCFCCATAENKENDDGSM